MSQACTLNQKKNEIRRNGYERIQVKLLTSVPVLKGKFIKK
jgi:hypothetical protein